MATPPRSTRAAGPQRASLFPGVNIGNVGVNVGVAAPMAFFPFAGRKASFFGDLHGQAGDAVRFFTDPKVVVSRWPKSSDGPRPLGLRH